MHLRGLLAFLHDLDAVFDSTQEAVGIGKHAMVFFRDQAGRQQGLQ